MKTPFHYFLLILITCFSIISVDGQHAIYIGGKGGISIPNLSAGSNNPLATGYKSSLGADFGILAEFPINRWFSIQSEIDYSQEGGKHNGLQPFINPYPDVAPQPYLYADFKSEVRLNYLMVSAMAKFNFNISKKLKAYINVGEFGGLLLGAKTLVSGSSHVYLDAAGQQEQQVYPDAVFIFDDNENIKDSLKSFNTGVIALVGFSYEVGRGKIFIEGGGNYGFISVQKNPDNGTNYAGAAIMHIGYEYMLRKRRKR